MALHATVSEWVAAHPLIQAAVRFGFHHLKFSMYLLGTAIYAICFGWLPLVRVATLRQIVRLYLCLVAWIGVTTLLSPLINKVVSAVLAGAPPVMSALWSYAWMLVILIAYCLRKSRLLRAVERGVRGWVGFPSPEVQ